jgi:hypothetical protein
MQDQTHTTHEEKLAFLFQPDTLLPAEYFNRLCKGSTLEPEKALMLAVLEDAISAFRDNVLAEQANKKLLFSETEEWIAEQDTDWIFSFENICEVFELNPQYLRKALRTWKDQRTVPTKPNTEKRRIAG